MSLLQSHRHRSPVTWSTFHYSILHTWLYPSFMTPSTFHDCILILSYTFRDSTFSDTHLQWHYLLSMTLTIHTFCDSSSFRDCVPILSHCPPFLAFLTRYDLLPSSLLKWHVDTLSGLSTHNQCVPILFYSQQSTPLWYLYWRNVFMTSMYCATIAPSPTSHLWCFVATFQTCWDHLFHNSFLFQNPSSTWANVLYL